MVSSVHKTREFLEAVFRQAVAEARPGLLLRAYHNDITSFCSNKPALVLAVGKAAYAMATVLQDMLPQLSPASLITEKCHSDPADTVPLADR